MKLFLYTFTLLSSLALAACGSSPGERALSGGAIGAGAGAVAGGLAGGSATTGAAIGGAVGAGVGAATDEDDIDFDK